MVSALRVAITISAVMRGARTFSEAEGRIKGLVGALKAMRIQLELLAAWQFYDFVRNAVGAFGAVQDKAYMTMAILRQQNESFKHLEDRADRLTTSLMKLSTAFPQTPDELGGAAYKFVSSGIQDNTKLLYDLRKAAQFATAGYTDMNTAAEVGIKAMAAYGDKLKDIGQAYDIIYRSANLAVASVNDYSTALTKVLPIASRMGVSFLEVNRDLSYLTRKFKDAQVAATALRRLYSQFTRMGTIRKLQDMGIQVLKNAQYTGEAADKWKMYNELLDTYDQQKTSAVNALQSFIKNNKDLDQTYVDIINNSGDYNIALKQLQMEYQAATQEAYKYDMQLKDLSTEMLEIQAQIEGTMIDVAKGGAVMTSIEADRLRNLKIRQMEVKHSIDETRVAQQKYLAQSRGLEQLIQLTGNVAKLDNNIKTTTDDMNNLQVSFADIKDPSEIIDEMRQKFSQMSEAEADAKLQAIGFQSAIGGKITAKMALMALLDTVKETTDETGKATNGLLTYGQMLDYIKNNQYGVADAYNLTTQTMNNQMKMFQNIMFEAFMPFAVEVAKFVKNSKPLILMLASAFHALALAISYVLVPFNKIFELGGGKGAEWFGDLLGVLTATYFVLRMLKTMYQGVVSVKRTLIAISKSERLIKLKNLLVDNRVIRALKIKILLLRTEYRKRKAIKLLAVQNIKVQQMENSSIRNYINIMKYSIIAKYNEIKANIALRVSRIKVALANFRDTLSIRARMASAKYSIIIKLAEIRTNIRLRLSIIKNTLAEYKAIISEKLHSSAKLTSISISIALIATTLREVGAKIMNKIATIASTIASYAATAAKIILAGATWLVTIATWAWNAALYANPIMWVIMLIMLLIVAIVLLIKNFDKVSAFFKNIGAAVMSGLKALWNFLVGLKDRILKMGSDFVHWFVDGIKNAFVGAKDFLWNLLFGWIKFDDWANDMMARKWGMDMIKHFNYGVSVEARHSGFPFNPVAKPLAVGAYKGDNINITVNANTNASPDEIARKVSDVIVRQKKRRLGGF